MNNLNPILYLDDEFINLESFRLQFEDEYQVFIAQTANEAYDILAKNEIKVVISDQRMPEISGIEFLETIKNKYQDITRIMLTAFILEEYLLEAINKGGVYRYLTKPWNFIELNVAIKGAIETYDLKAENKALIVQLKEKISLLSVSEEKFRNIFNSSTDAILIIDKDKKIKNANQSLSRIMGYTLDQVLGVSIVEFVVPDQKKLLFNRVNEIFITKSHDYIEYQVITKYNEVVFVEVKSTIIEYEGETALLSMLHDITEKKQFEKQLYIARVNAEEKERERIAKELHDGIGPLLSTLKIYLYDIKKSEQRQQQDASIQKSDEIIGEAISCVKEISNNFSPHVLRNFGLEQAIKGFIEKLVVKPNLKVHFNTNLNKRLNEIIEITLYRIATELINNTLKYANAKNISIGLTKSEKMISFNYTDDGVGFNYEDTMKENRGFGIQNIKSRIVAIGGQIDYTSEQGKGMNVQININL